MYWFRTTNDQGEKWFNLEGVDMINFFENCDGPARARIGVHGEWTILSREDTENLKHWLLEKAPSYV